MLASCEFITHTVRSITSVAREKPGQIGIDAQAVTHDAVGNLASVDTKSYQYNSANRWKAYLNNGSTIATMKYSAVGQRVRKSTGDVTADHHYSVNKKLLGVSQTRAGAGSVESYEYIYLDGLPIGQVTTVKTNQIVTSRSLYYLHGDQLGTPRIMTNGDGENVWLWSSDGFGEAAPITDADEDGIDVAMNLRFAGQYYDADLGTNYNYFRDYDPSLGRYLQSDPIGLEGGLNTFGYVNGNPISNIDPLGLETYQCIRGLGQKPGGYVSPGNITHHQYSCITLKNGKTVCGGQGPGGNPLKSPGKPTTPDEDYYHENSCKKTQDDNQCFEQCLQDEWAKPRPTYSILPGLGTHCQEYDDDVNTKCRKQCGLK